MSKESQFWASIRPAFREGHATRVENPACPGTPDVNWCVRGVEGWIELKSIRKPPARPTTIVRCRHYTQEQKIWLTERKKAGGRVHLLVKIGKRYMLFSSRESFERFGSVPMGVLAKLAQATWLDRLDKQELIEELMNG